ncbi:hypothetical protein QBC47DRAFT_373899 [Echria macrotheca]|uniref:SPT2 chromatin protein n=1 Tax=Echria macrotheca TaxID=438768 RepID=A0AAJ0BHV0_9PEZI|nr:hypothetical protein QBC47DRAFT_373899 [Echria macrotheca]
MPLSDILASIEGDKPLPSPVTSARPDLPPAKRKATDELRPTPASKVGRSDLGSTASSRANGESSRPSPHAADRASNPKAKPALNPQTSKTPSTTLARNGVKPSSADKPLSATRPLPTRPLDSRPVNTDSGSQSGQKKKGSYAEILARAKANQELRESFGKIQHKAVEKKPLTMKERKQLKAEEARQAKLSSRKQGDSKYAGTASAARGAAAGSSQRAGLASKSAGAKDKSAPTPEVKKVKKAALATTGYAGTARPSTVAPKPGAAAGSKREADRDRPRYRGPLAGPRRKREDEDDDLDDFIDYDEDEDEGGYGGHGGYGRPEYDSAEDESDMEAGLTDLEEEEARTAKLARLEDEREQRVLERLKAEKERKKRSLVQGTSR